MQVNKSKSMKLYRLWVFLYNLVIFFVFLFWFQHGKEERKANIWLKMFRTIHTTIILIMKLFLFVHLCTYILCSEMLSWFWKTCTYSQNRNLWALNIHKILLTWDAFFFRKNCTLWCVISVEYLTYNFTIFFLFIDNIKEKKI